MCIVPVSWFCSFNSHCFRSAESAGIGLGYAHGELQLSASHISDMFAAFPCRPSAVAWAPSLHPSKAAQYEAHHQLDDELDCLIPIKLSEGAAWIEVERVLQIVLCKWFTDGPSTEVPVSTARPGQPAQYAQVPLGFRDGAFGFLA